MSFVRLNPEDFVVSADSITSTLWSGQNPVLSQFFSSSTQEATNRFFLEVYNTGSGISGSEVQFSISYGNLY